MDPIIIVLLKLICTKFAIYKWGARPVRSTRFRHLCTGG